MTDSIVIRIVVDPSGKLNVTGNCPLPVMVGTIEMAKQALIAGAMQSPPSMVQGSVDAAAPIAAARVPGFAPVKVA